MVMNATGCRVGIRDRYGTLPVAGRAMGCGAGAGGKVGRSRCDQPLPAAGGAAEGAEGADEVDGVGAAEAVTRRSVGRVAEAPGGAGGAVAGDPVEQAARASPRRARTAAVRARRGIGRVTCAR